MKTASALFAVALLSIGTIPARQETTEPSPCALVQQALEDSRRIGAGVERQEVEKYFHYDGGVQFPDYARFTYPKCSYIKLEVRFDAARNRGGNPTSPHDKVRTVSKLFIGYPVKD